ncbi:hypothetical protein SDC9_162409 [bioreactor metagenome]|uniref:Uncharacterized protein n=1 Tax=bioreactor metagenome TaxID=1076179 RepID=A0A645FMB0_9ZZZZ
MKNRQYSKQLLAEKGSAPLKIHVKEKVPFQKQQSLSLYMKEKVFFLKKTHMNVLLEEKKTSNVLLLMEEEYIFEKVKELLHHALIQFLRQWPQELRQDQVSLSE